MRTVKEVSSLTGVSVRALHHYDAVGLLHPTKVTQAGYRLYDDTALERLQMILLFRTLQFPLKEIAEILDSPGFDRGKALRQQIELLTLQKEHIEQLISFARGINITGGKNMDFSAFDTKKMDEYAEQAKSAWGKTEAWGDYEKKSAGRGKDTEKTLAMDMMDIFRRIGELRGQAPDSDDAQALVKELQSFITANYYTCTKEILKGLGAMYAAGGEMTENIDRAGGEGTAVFSAQAIAFYCK